MTPKLPFLLNTSGVTHAQ